jgi:hypothetical protein
MTETEWLACADPRAMLLFLHGKAGGRKLRLFACACCSRIGDLLTEQSGRQAVEVAERYADGRAGKAELKAARDTARRRRQVAAFCCATLGSKTCRDFGAAADWAVELRANDAAGRRAGDPIHTKGRDWWAARRLEQAAQAELLKDVFGNPFRPVSVSPSWLTWNGGTVAKLAAAIYDERRFADLPVLADALEDAGCADAAILGHCRGPGEHVRGCWVVDLLLGRQ